MGTRIYCPLHPQKELIDILVFDMILSAHDTAVRQSTLPSAQGHHATSASTYLHFHGHALLSSLRVLRRTADNAPDRTLDFLYLYALSGN